jgi:hypothetical protein
MHFLRFFDRKRIALSLAVIGLLASTVGCDSGGGGGTSTVAPPTPPPGFSGADQAKARSNAYPTKNVPKKETEK